MPWKDLVEKPGPDLAEPTTERGVCPLLVPGLVLVLVYGVFVFPVKTQTEGLYSPCSPSVRGTKECKRPC